MSGEQGSSNGARRRVVESVVAGVIVLILGAVGSLVVKSLTSQEPGRSSASRPSANVGSATTYVSTLTGVSTRSGEAGPSATGGAVDSSTMSSAASTPTADVNGVTAPGHLSLSELHPINYPHWGGDPRVATLGQTQYPGSFISSVARGGSCTDTWTRHSDYVLPAGYATFQGHFGLADDSVDSTVTARVMVQAIQPGGSVKDLYSGVMKVGVDKRVVVGIRGVQRLRLAYQFLSGTGEYVGCGEALVVAGAPELIG